MFNLIPWILFHLVTVVVVTAQPTPPPKGDSYDLYSRLDPTMLIVVMVLVGAFLLVGCLSVYIRHCNESYAIAVSAAAAASSAQRFRSNGLDKETIESFPVFVYSHVKELKIGKGALECAVCLSEFEDDETLRFIPKCCHVFHPDCIDAWLAHHVTCPLCRTKLSPPESDGKDQPIESVSDSNITEFNSNHNSNNNEESNHPRTERSVEQNESVVIQVNEETRPIRKITGKFPRSHSTGHSMIQPGENIERFTLRLPEEIRKQIERSGRLKRTRSYDVVLGMEGSSKKGGDGSSRGKSMIERWVVFSRNPPVKSPKCGGGDEGDGSISWRGLTSVKDKLNCLSLKMGQVEKEDSSSRPPV